MRRLFQNGKRFGSEEGRAIIDIALVVGMVLGLAVILVMILVMLARPPSDDDVQHDLGTAGIAMTNYAISTVDELPWDVMPQFPDGVTSLSSGDTICLVGEGRSGFWGLSMKLGSGFWLFGFSASEPSVCVSAEWTWSTSWWWSDFD